MPHNKVSKAVKSDAALKDEVKTQTVLTNGTGIIDAAIAGDQQASTLLIAGQMKKFQVSNDDKIIKGAENGEELGKGLLEHV